MVASTTSVGKTGAAACSEGGVSRFEELLRRKRAAQIAQMEGESTDGEVDAELEAYLQKASKRMRRKRSSAIDSEKLRISKHCWTRMAQRRMEVKHLYALWLYGERRELRAPGRTAHAVTMAALTEMPKRERKLLRRLVGAVLLVQAPDEPGAQHVAVTVIADGEDTRCW